jgi:hypothetical protein
MRPPLVTGMHGVTDGDTVFVRNPDSSFSPAYGQGNLARNRFPRHHMPLAPRPVAQSQHPRGAPNYQNPNAFAGAQPPAGGFARPHHQSHMGASLTMLPMSPRGPVHGAHGYYPTTLSAPIYPGAQHNNAAYDQQQQHLYSQQMLMHQPRSQHQQQPRPSAVRRPQPQNPYAFQQQSRMYNDNQGYQPYQSDYLSPASRSCGKSIC